MKQLQDILLCDLDAFYASVEQRDNPSLKGKPVLVGGRPEDRGVVSTCSYEARRYGIHSAMPMKRALSLCPDAIIIHQDMDKYVSVSKQVGAIFSQHTPCIEPVSIDEAYLGLPSGTGLSTANIIQAEVSRQLSLPLSIGVSKNKLLAKIACELAKPNRVLAIWPEDVTSRLWPLPVKVLPGVGPATREILNRQGIKTVKDLAAVTEDALDRLLGKTGRTLHQYARGIDHRSIEKRQELKSISEETTFSEDITEHQYMLSILQQLSAGVGYRLRGEKLTAATITLKLRFEDFRTISRSKTLPATTDSDTVIYENARELFNKHCQQPPWRLAGVQVSNLEKGEQLSLFSFDSNAQRNRHLLETGDQLRKKYGNKVLFKGSLLTVKEKDL